MNARLAAILVVLLVILGGGALLYQYQERTQRPANSDVLGRPLLKDLKAAEVASIRIVEPKATLTVRQKDERWVLAGAQPDEKLEVTKANAASYSLGLLELADVAPQGTTLEQPVSIQATTFDGLTYAIRVGKLQGDNYPVGFSSSGTLRKDDKDAERIKKIEERLPREKLLSNYVLLIPKSKLEDTLKKRAEMLEKKDDAKKK